MDQQQENTIDQRTVVVLRTTREKQLDGLVEERPIWGIKTDFVAYTAANRRVFIREIWQPDTTRIISPGCS